MADYLAAIGPAETVERRWAAPVVDDGAQSVAVSASGITATAELDGDEVVFTLSAGTLGTAHIDVTVTTSAGSILVERLYIPVVANTSGVTVQDIVAFALRKVTGSGETPDADQAADALERLADMLEEWRVTGADVGALRPLTLSTTIYSPHSHISAIKHNLIVRLSDLYGSDITPSVANAAVRGLQLVKAGNLSADRTGSEYF